jgi:glycosyltransferase involved in cell wall biosynthesis
MVRRVAGRDELPFASIAIPTRNEAKTIEACLRSLLAQDYPHDRFEILVLDGRSEDATRGLVEAVAAVADVEIRLLGNPAGSVPAALNAALREARGEYLVRVDAHSEPAPSYVRRSIEANVELGAALAGGWVRAVGTNAFGRAVAAAFASPFAMGNPASWNAPGAPRPVDSVPCGSYRVEALRGIGGFDEEQHANQDFEANYRLRAAGGSVILLPDVHFDYITRDNPAALARQFARYGFYKARTMVKHPASIRARQFVPAAGLAGAATLAALAPAWRPARVALAGGALLYAAGLAGATVVSGRRLGRDALLLPAVFATMHASWAVGNVAGLARWVPARRRVRR